MVTGWADLELQVSQAEGRYFRCRTCARYHTEDELIIINNKFSCPHCKRAGWIVEFITCDNCGAVHCEDAFINDRCPDCPPVEVITEPLSAYDIADVMAEQRYDMLAEGGLL
jgi:hypothetical protein